MQAYDRGLPSRSSFMQITVSVLDVNDNPPIFTNKTYELKMREDINHPTHLLSLHALDLDDASNAVVR